MKRGEEKEDCRKIFFEKFSESFLDQLENGAGLLEVFGKRPQERWLYGFIGQALGEVLQEGLQKGDKRPWVLTEVPVDRVGEKGRIDFIFQFKGHLFMMEVKAGVCSLHDDKVEIPKRLIETWGVARKQLQDIKLDERQNKKLLSMAERRRCIRFALLLVTCGNTGKQDDLEKDKDEIKKKINELEINFKKQLKAELAASRSQDRKPFIHVSEKEYADESKKMRREFGWILLAGKVPYK